MTPATVAAILQAPCEDISTGRDLHNIFIHRDGNVSTPTHVESEEHQAATLLGSPDTSTCAHWRRSGSGRAVIESIPEGREEWKFIHVEMWTPAASRTALRAITGQVAGEVLDPVSVLSYVQVFLKHQSMPTNTLDTFARLMAPTRGVIGWRRSHPATAQEVSALLTAGVLADRIASATSLDISAGDAQIVLSRLKEAGEPSDLLYVFANALHPSVVARAVEDFDPTEMRDTVKRLGGLRHAIETGEPMSILEVETMLFGTRDGDARRDGSAS